jgi:hypothetical protein
LGFGVQGLDFGAWGSGVLVFGLGGLGLWFGDWVLGFGNSGLGFGLMCKVLGSEALPRDLPDGWSEVTWDFYEDTGRV